MPYRRKLRFRIFLSYPLLGLIISLITLVLLILAFETLERQFLDNHINDELAYFIELSDKQPQLWRHQSKQWVVHKVDATGPPGHLAYLSQYPEGIQEIEKDNIEYHLGVVQQNGYRYYMLYDDTTLENLKRNIILYMIAAVFFIIWLAIWYGLSLSKKVMEPISSLASRIETLQTGDMTVFPLAQEYAKDEVGILAREFDSYHQRLQQLLQRERDFTGNVSHELRTPLAVISVASESLSHNPALPKPLVEKVFRIQRAADDMAACLDALLILAREPPDGIAEEAERIIISKALKLAIADHHELLNPEMQLIQEMNANPVIHAPLAVVRILLGNLLKNALTHVQSGSVTLILDQCSVTVIDTGCGISENELEHVFERGYRSPHSRGSGFGLEICKRICERYHWQLQLQSKEKCGTLVCWDFSEGLD